MNYIESLAKRIEDELPPGSLPKEDAARLLHLYALLALVKGEEVSRKDVHDAWAAWMTEQDPDHESIKPFDQLDPEVRAEDEPFMHAIQRTAGRRK